MEKGKNSSLKENEKDNKNEISCSLYIEEDNYDKDILLFNNNKNNKNEFIDDNINAYLKGNKINIKNIEDGWILNYNFKEKGEYEIKIIFNKRMTNINKLFGGCEMLYSIDLSNFDTSNVTDMEYLFACCDTVILTVRL